MKIEELKKVLNESGADNWKIIETVKHGWEFYYIKHELDQNRVTDVKTIEIIVYKNYDNDQYTGLAAATINPSETDEYIKKTVADLVAQSEYVKDRYFDLKEPKKANETISKELAPLADISKEFIRTMDSVNETETEDINSYEIFTSHITKRIITSK
jgi:PmbA protein